jgi:preprotein translocase subunit SecA
MNLLESWNHFRHLIYGPALPPAGAQRQVAAIRELSATLRSRTDAQLRGEAEELRAELAAKRLTTVHAIPPAFALVVEAARRVLDVDYYDVQLEAGLALAAPAIAEMQTGEGKTLTAALPAMLHALGGRGVHVATPNAYLARRDHGLVEPLFALLGVRAGLLPEAATTEAKAAAYACDVTYGTGYEFGFDYLRDQLELLSRPPRTLGDQLHRRLAGTGEQASTARQRPLAVAIIDEIDAVLLDEACLPLVLAGSGTPACAAAYQTARALAGRLQEQLDYRVDPRRREVALTDRGRAASFEALQRAGALSLARPWEAYVRQALHAALLLRKDVDYLVDGGKVLLVDMFTGRIFGDRSWRDGLHQSVEAKESLAISPEQTTTARISRQKYFARYATICGMTGTAAGSERELWSAYRLPVISIPPRLPSRRQMLETRYFPNAEAKWRAAVEEIAGMKASGRPILIGSRTIENSRSLSARLAAAGLEHQLLNGVQDEEEARIVARAGQLGIVTIATNMAGRGTDIRLGPGVVDLGGLHLLAVERHESRRVDRQLVGRVARQGDPGTCRFLVAAEDPLIEAFASQLGQRLQGLPETGRADQDLDRRIEACQQKAEGQAYADRRRMLAYDTWLDEVLAELAKRD